ncbi:MAG: formimidoylglutamate deiminase [Gemmatimonadales bacterium]
MSPSAIQAELTWIDGTFLPGIQITVGPGGRIEAVGAPEEAPSPILWGTALLPGFVNTHSHAFQRGLRGAGEDFPAGAGSFWSWREAMYSLVDSLHADTLHRLCRQAFGEMRDAGTTTVGEFHYLHHQEPGDFAFDEIVLQAAAEVGIRIVLLQAYYATGSIGKPLEGAQRRFATPSLEGYWRQWERLDLATDGATQTLGVAPHSVRAAGLGEIRELYEEAIRRRRPFHMHVEEQRGEVEQAMAAYGRAPMAALCDSLDIAGNFTAVHCTHTDPRDMARFLSAGGTICLCPATEGNLGDGIPDLSSPLASGSLSLGSDSNLRIAPVEEMRWLEYGQRLRGEFRGALADGRGRVATTLLAAATVGGSHALGVEGGRIAPGHWADLVAVDLRAPALADVPAERLLEAILFGSGNEAIAGTYVGGRWRETGAPSA